jgi:hypothetical protein
MAARRKVAGNLAFSTLERIESMNSKSAFALATLAASLAGAIALGSPAGDRTICHVRSLLRRRLSCRPQWQLPAGQRLRRQPLSAGMGTALLAQREQQLVHAQRRILNQRRHGGRNPGDWQDQPFEQPELLQFAPKRGVALFDGLGPVERS